MGRVASRDEKLVESRDVRANLGVHERRRLVDPERPPWNDTGGEARGEVGKEFAAIAVHAPARPDHYLFMKLIGAPRQTQSPLMSPFPSGLTPGVYASSGV